MYVETDNAEQSKNICMHANCLFRDNYSYKMYIVAAILYHAWNFCILVVFFPAQDYYVFSFRNILALLLALRAGLFPD